MKFYAGIGSRQTPKNILDIMEKISIKLEVEGWTLRSGGARGADSAFGKNVSNKEIYLPWQFFNGISSKYYRPQNWSYEIAEKYVEHWNNLKPQFKKLHARNVHQILGYKENSKNSSFVICWTPDGELIGGTATAIKIANAYNVPVFNLGIESNLNRVIEFL